MSQFKALHTLSISSSHSVDFPELESLRTLSLFMNNSDDVIISLPRNLKILHIAGCDHEIQKVLPTRLEYLFIQNHVAWLSTFTTLRSLSSNGESLPLTVKQKYIEEWVLRFPPTLKFMNYKGKKIDQTMKFPIQEMTNIEFSNVG